MDELDGATLEEIASCLDLSLTTGVPSDPALSGYRLVKLIVNETLDCLGEMIERYGRTSLVNAIERLAVERQTAGQLQELNYAELRRYWRPVGPGYDYPPVVLLRHALSLVNLLRVINGERVTVSATEVDVAIYRQQFELFSALGIVQVSGKSIVLGPNPTIILRRWAEPIDGIVLDLSEGNAVEELESAIHLLLI